MTEYVLDPTTADLRFHARGLWGAVPVTGTFGRASGHLTWHAGATGSVDIRVDADSIDTGIALRDRHLRGTEFLDTDRHPSITYRGDVSVAPGGLRLDGSLTVRGLESTQVVDVSTSEDGRNITGLVRATIDLNAFEIMPPFKMTRREVRLVLRGSFRPR
jgi:polyisoprenoid-binding protein YceI